LFFGPLIWLLIAFSSKRVQQQKRRKEKERKDLETLGRKQYLDVRIVQRNVIYVVGLGPRYAKEEVILFILSRAILREQISDRLRRPSPFCDRPTTSDATARSPGYSCKSVHRPEELPPSSVSTSLMYGARTRNGPCRPSTGARLPAVVAR